MTTDLTAARKWLIPAGALKVADKASDAVCYIYSDANGRPCATGFCGRRTKADFRFRYSSPERREAAVREYFQNRRAVLERQKDRRKPKARKLEVGHILMAMWGYEQTNVDFFQVTALVGSTMVELRPIRGNTTGESGYMQGYTVPRADAFTGDPIRRRVNGDRVRIDDVRSASIWDGRPVNWTAYH